MGKRILLIFLGLVILIGAIFAIVKIRNKEDSNMKKVRVADATITSLTVAIA